MNEKDQPDQSLSLSGEDIRHMLEYRGPSLRQEQRPEGGVSLLDFRDSDENERNISILLSAKGIPFSIERPQWSWSGTRVRLTLTIPRERYVAAEAVLSAASKISVVEVVEGMEGLIS